MSCWELFKKKDKDIDAKLELIDNIKKAWKSSSRLMTASDGDMKFFKRLYKDITNKDFDYSENLPSYRRLKKLENAIGRMEKRMAYDESAFAYWFKLPKNILEKDPITKQYGESLSITGDRYRGNMERHISNLDTMVKLIDKDLKVNAVASKFGLSRNTARKKLLDMESEFLRRRSEGGDFEEYYRDNLSRKALLKDTEMNVLQSFHELIINPKNVYADVNNKSKGYSSDAKANYTTNMLRAAHLWHSEISPAMHKLLVNGLRSYVATLKKASLRTNGQNIDERLNKLIENIEKKDYYVPTQVLDVFPVLAKFVQDTHTGELGKDPKSMRELTDNVFNMIDNSLSLSPHALPKGDKAVVYQSKDVLGVLDKYIKNVVRFNYVSRASEILTKATEGLENYAKTDHQPRAEWLLDYIKQTHADAIGLTNQNSSVKNFARALTSYQFLSKLGFNLRTAARNATQGLQNWVWFGRKAWSEANSFVKGEKMHEVLQEEMKKHGVFFVDIEEMAGKHRYLPETKVVEKDGMRVVEEVNPSRIEETLRLFENSKITKAAGAPMQYIENKWNRATTFKIAFVQHYNELGQNNSIVTRAVKTNKKAFMNDWNKNMPNKTTLKHLKVKDKDSPTVEQLVENEIIRKSSRFAANAVKELHYDYSIYAKPTALRTPVGAVLGQFSTYSINFFEYQRKIATSAGKDILAGDLGTVEARRAYRLASLYGFTSGVLGPLFNTDIGNLIQNDTLDRLHNLYWYLAAEPGDHVKYNGVVSNRIGKQMQAIKELRAMGQLGLKPQHITQSDWNNKTQKQLAEHIRKKENKQAKELDKFNTKVNNAFFGGGLEKWFLGPSVNDIIFYGNLYKHWKMSEKDANELYNIYTGEAKRKNNAEERDYFYEIARTINPQVARTFFQTLPNTLQGNQTIMTSLGQELGLYRPKYLDFSIKDYRERKESILAGIRTVAPKWVDPYFTTRTKEPKPQPKNTKVGSQYYSDKDLDAIFGAINRINK